MSAKGQGRQLLFEWYLASLRQQTDESDGVAIAKAAATI